MSAIFAVWNSKGVALAADQIYSLVSSDNNGNQLTRWTDTDTKIIELHGHQIAVATAGSDSVNRIPVSAIIRTWSKTLEEPLDSLSDYIASFIRWYSEEALPADDGVLSTLETRLNRILLAINQESQERELPLTESAKLLVELWSSTEPPNVYGTGVPNWLKTSKSEQLGATDELLRDFMKSLSDLEPEMKDWRAIEFELILNCFCDVFEEIFNRPLDQARKDDKNLAQIVVDYVINYIDEERGDASFMFVGYGKKDWIPHAGIIHLHSYLAVNPRISVERLTNSDTDWYVALAQSSSVFTLTRGFNTNIMEEVVTTLSSKSAEKSRERFVELGRNSFVAMMNKIDWLNIPKLEFVARSFVEIESLGSFLSEDLPSVGGRVDVISIQK